MDNCWISCQVMADMKKSSRRTVYSEKEPLSTGRSKMGLDNKILLGFLLYPIQLDFFFYNKSTFI